MIKSKGPWFIDEFGRTVMLRGVNLGGSTKVPTRPNGATYNPEGFFEHRQVSFVGRPFPLEETDEHYARLRSWGFNCLRFLVTWEAVEHAGPGIYDEEYLDYLYEVVKKAGEYGFYVFIDPHQDVYSRFSGGDGAPGWTLEAAGLDMKHFKETGAAIVHQTHGDPFPRMIWPTNAYKLAAATMFTLFFAGNDFAPNTLVEGKPIQDYMQNHYFDSMKKVAIKLKNLTCVMGFDTMNEPQRGYVEVNDLSQPYGELDMGICPTPWQSMLLGSGYTQKINHLERTFFGTRNFGQVELNPGKKSAWLPGRKCVWRENGVWDLDQNGNPILLQPDYFSKVNGRKVNFTQDYLVPFIKKMIAAFRSVSPEWIGFIESEVNQLSPFWAEAANQNIVYVPHWYDGAALFFKKFSSFLGYDIINKKPVMGKKKVERSFAHQLSMAKQLSKERLGNIPVLIGEIGIPYDMQNKKAYFSGNFSNQIKAMNRSIRALEENLLNYTLWNYTADNTNERGDLWNDEDLSIFSRDQQNNRNDLNSGGRALKAVIRPFPMCTAGEPIMARFDYRSVKFEFEFKGDPSISAPTEIFYPTFQYPDGAEIEISDGNVEMEIKKQLIRYYPGDQSTHRIKLKRK
ncbi:MAG: putative glycosidase [Chloroflexi bacterium]|nr:MAG: putative glycosidase [Chloroflexota bacterium]MBA4376386.1 glycosyl hydrolase family 35 [Anaerolinea sp.]